MDGESYIDQGIRLWYLDHNGAPIVRVANVNTGREWIVDVVRSLERDPSTVSHPLMVATIVECTDAIRFKLDHPFNSTHPDQKTAERWLKSIFAALLAGAKRLRKENEEYRKALKIAEDVEPSYFMELWKLLKDRHLRTTDRTIMKVEEWQKKWWSDYGEPYDSLNQEIIKFLREILIADPGTRSNTPSPKRDNKYFREQESDLRLPKRGGGPALQNLFIGWKSRRGAAQAKNRISAARAYLRKYDDQKFYTDNPKLGILLEDERDSLIERFHGVNTIDAVVAERLDTSGLVIHEGPVIY